jgi:hypothetical protein
LPKGLVAFYEIQFQIAHVHFPKTAFTTVTENTEKEKNSNGEELRRNGEEEGKARSERRRAKRRRNGEEVAWNNLDHIWDVVTTAESQLKE